MTVTGKQENYISLKLKCQKSCFFWWQCSSKKFRYSHLYPCDILRYRGRAKSVEGGRGRERDKIKLSGKSRTWDQRVVGWSDVSWDAADGGVTQPAASSSLAPRALSPWAAAGPCCGTGWRWPRWRCAGRWWGWSGWWRWAGAGPHPWRWRSPCSAGRRLQMENQWGQPEMGGVNGHWTRIPHWDCCRSPIMFPRAQTACSQTFWIGECSSCRKRGTASEDKKKEELWGPRHPTGYND